MGALQTQLNKRNVGLIGIVLLFLILLFVVVYKLLPLNKDLSGQKDEMEQLNRQVAILSNKISEKSKSEASYSQAKVQEALPLSDNTEQMLLDLKSISQENKTTLNNVSFSLSDSNQLQTMLGGANAPYASVKELKVAVSINGTYEQIINWITSLQKLPRLINVDTFSLSKPALADMQKPISFNVSFTSYYDSSYRSLVEKELTAYND